MSKGETEYISREAVRNEVEHLDMQGLYTPADFLSILEDAKGADVCPVVRCRDCAYCRHEDEYEHWCNGFRPAKLVPLDGYCHHGQRKEAAP